MAVSDPQGILGFESPSVVEKYDELTKMFYLKGKPELRGSLPIRILDTVLLRTFGLLVSLGKRRIDLEGKYERLTKNFKRMGNLAKPMRFLGPLGRWLVRQNFKLYAKDCPPDVVAAGPTRKKS